jgi:hypothetical protein
MAIEMKIHGSFYRTLELGSIILFILAFYKHLFDNVTDSSAYGRGAYAIARSTVHGHAQLGNSRAFSTLWPCNPKECGSA